MKTISLRADHRDAIGQAAAALLRGELVAFPTDTVYGVGAHPFMPEAIAGLYRAKERSLDKAIPLLLASVDELPRVARDIPDHAWALARRFWPGALTIILPGARDLPDILCAGGDTVALRVPDHPVAMALIAAAGGAVATTSANLSGDPPALTAEEAESALAGKVHIILDDGLVPGGMASTILDLTATPPRLLRAGPISESDLLSFLESGERQEDNDKGVSA